MCGRFAFFHEIEPLIDDLDAVDLTGGALHRRFNIPPTVPIHVVTEGVERDTGELVRALRLAKWGLLPRFARDESAAISAFNARRETLIEKPTFKPSLGKYRAVIPMSGYYEWKRDADGGKQPHFISAKSEAPLYAAGLMSWWKAPERDAPWVLSATVITQAAEGHLTRIHDRSPVFLTPTGADRWLSLDSFASPHEAHEWINSGDGQLSVTDITTWPVSSAVGNVRAQSPELIEDISPHGFRPRVGTDTPVE